MRLYEIDDNPERRLMLDKLLSFMEERGSPIMQCPTISKNPLDLFRLYVLCRERGGYIEVGCVRTAVICSYMVQIFYLIQSNYLGCVRWYPNNFGQNFYFLL